MTDTLSLLKTLTNTAGLSGHETPARHLIEEAWRPLADELRISPLGSLHALKRGIAAAPRPSILLATHMDIIGLLVTGIVDGFIRITSIGGIDARVLPGQSVIVHGKKDIPGVIVQPPSFLLPPPPNNDSVPIENLFVDTGLEPAEIARLIQIGDLISFDRPLIELSDDFYVGRSLDNRSSVVALTECLQILQGRQTIWDVWAAATVQEEVTLGGAATSAFQLRPALAVAIDVTWGDSPGSPAHKTFPSGKGITLGWGPNIHPYLFNTFQEIAERLEIPHKTEIMPNHSGTDAYAMQVAAEGIPTMVISFPIRYMHTPVEIVSYKDIHRTARLLAEFVSALPLDYLEKITWE